MQLFLNQPHFSGPLLLLFLTNLLLWGNVASEPKCHEIDGHCELFLEELFDHTTSKSKNIYNMALSLFNEFVINDFSSKMYEKFAIMIVKRDRFLLKAFQNCHTNSLRGPLDKHRARRVDPFILLNKTLSLVSAWNWPLNYLLVKLPGMQGAPDAILSMVNEIKKNREELLDDVHRLRKKVYPEVETNENYPEWPELATTLALEEKSQFLAFYKVVYCLRFDTYTAYMYLMVVRCQIIYKNNCPSNIL